MNFDIYKTKNRTPVKQLRIQACRAQQGVVLMVSLVMLLVLSLLGVANMNMTTLELKMAANTQNQNHCFQAAESGIDLTINAERGEAYGIDYSDPNDQRSLGVVDTNPYATANVDAVFRGQVTGASCPGSSIRKFSCMHFEIQSNARQDASGSACRHLQGVFRVATAPQG